MKKSDNIKERIISAATELIIINNGDIDNISTRSIAQKAGSNAALINYHFGSKNNLMEVCIQRIISGVVSSFRADLNETDSIKRLKNTSKSLVDFLCNNEAISRISILGDMSKPHMNDNTTNTIRGFNRGLSECHIPDEHKRILTFMLTSIIQSIFLRKNLCTDLLQFDFNNKSERDLFIDFMIDRLFLDGGKINENINH